MKLRFFLPIAAVTAVTASMVSVAAPARAALLGTGTIDLAGVGPLYYTQNAVDFTSTFNSAPTPGTAGAAYVVSSTGSFATAVPPVISPVTIKDIFNTTAFASNVASGAVPTTQLLDFGNGTTFSFKNVTRTVDPTTKTVALNFVGFFQNGADQSAANLAVITGQETTPFASTPVLSSLAGLTAANSGRSSYSMSLSLIEQKPPTVPEPSNVVGTLVFGLMGAGAMLKRRRASIR